MAPEQTVHLFTGSKIGFPGPRIGFLYSQAELAIADGRTVALSDLALTEASSDILFQNPGALRSFEAMLHAPETFTPLTSMWPLAETKLKVYRENREILLHALGERLGDHPELFNWTTPQAGFFSVFSFHDPKVRTDDEFIAKELVAEHGLVVIPMYDFYPQRCQSRAMPMRA